MQKRRKLSFQRAAEILCENCDLDAVHTLYEHNACCKGDVRKKAPKQFWLHGNAILSDDGVICVYAVHDKIVEEFAFACPNDPKSGFHEHVRRLLFLPRKTFSNAGEPHACAPGQNAPNPFKCPGRFPSLRSEQGAVSLALFSTVARRPCFLAQNSEGTPSAASAFHSPSLRALPRRNQNPSPEWIAERSKILRGVFGSVFVPSPGIFSVLQRRETGLHLKRPKEQ